MLSDRDVIWKVSEGIVERLKSKCMRNYNLMILPICAIDFQMQAKQKIQCAMWCKANHSIGVRANDVHRESIARHVASLAKQLFRDNCSLVIANILSPQ